MSPTSSRIHRTTYYVLATLLKEGPLHAYALEKAVSALSEGEVTLKSGNLIRRLETLVSNDWVGKTQASPETGRSFVYSLTEAGRSALYEERRKVARDVAVLDALEEARGGD